MPELPEVEAIRQAIEGNFKGEALLRLEILHSDVWDAEPGCTNPELLRGCRLEAVERRGKYLIFRFSNDYRLILHLRMTGQLRVYDLDAPTIPHTHARFIWEGRRIDFRDVRRFGRLELSRSDSMWKSASTLKKLGPEPVPSDLTTDYLREQARRHPKLPLKAFLLDQSVVAGLGNIYADEVAHHSGLHPARLVRQLKRSDWEQVRASTITIIRRALVSGGTSFSDYIHLDGTSGSYQEVALVYTRAGLPCRSCGTPLIKTRVAGRGTVYCPDCQTAPRGFKA